MLVIDTNVLVYAADDAAREQSACRRILEESHRGRTPWYVTWGIVYEFLSVVTHPRVLRQPREISEAWSFVTALLASPSNGVLVATPQHAEMATRVVNDHRGILSGNLLHDAHTVALMHEHGVSRIVTRDADFHRFRDVEVVDPLST
ncbi:MAG: PIN domain-containing protein [Actinomycetota bacterium]|nr:PIN domain-containing protein [Actinomycetota bacterium]